MTMMRNHGWLGRRGLLPLTLALAMFAESGNADNPRVVPPPPPPDLPLNPSPPPPTGNLAPAQRLARVVDLLMLNDEQAAKVELQALLKVEPHSRPARTLSSSIYGNPRDLVPRGSFSYIVTARDTYVTLARDYLGDSYKFWALARLNGIAGTALKEGDVIQIPGRLRGPIQERSARARPAAPPPRRARPDAAPDVQAAGPAAAPAAPHADPARARPFRRRGLERMAAGRIDQAVADLQQAARLDPGDGAIAEDLARARRIQGAVRKP